MYSFLMLLFTQEKVTLVILMCGRWPGVGRLDLVYHTQRKQYGGKQYGGKQSQENAPAKYHIYVKLPLNANVVFRWSKGLCQLEWV